MVKVYAGVDSIKLAPKTATAGLEVDYKETTIKKFGTASFKPAGNGTTSSGGGLGRQAYCFNQSSQSSTRVFRQTGFFDVTETSEQDNSYAWDCWFYLNSSSSGNTNNNTPSIFSWDGPRSISGSNRSYELRVISDSELRIQLCEGFSTTNISNSINASIIGETDFLDQWIWVAFQKSPGSISGNPASKYEGWIGTSGSANKFLDSTQRLLYVPGISLDQYRVGATGTGSGTPGFTPIDGYIDEVAIRKGAPFSGTVTCPTSEYTGDEDGMLELYHYSSTTGQLYTNSGNGIDSSDNGSSINGSPGLYLSTFNPNATTTQLNDDFFGTGYTALQLGDVNAGSIEIVSVTGQSLSTSLNNLVPENQVVGVSLKAENRTSKYSNTNLVTTPIPFSGLRSIDCGAKDVLRGIIIPSQGFPSSTNNEYSFYNDFTVEMFLRGDGTTNDGSFLDIGININNFGSPASRLLFAIDGDELQMNNAGTGSTYNKLIGADIGTRTTTDWYHFACIRKDNKYSLFWNGERVAYNIDSAGNGTADTINIGSADQYLFKPFSGNIPVASGNVQEVVVGDGLSIADWGGYIANYRSSYIAQYNPDDPTLTVPTEPFDLNASGQSYYYKDSNATGSLNSSTNLPETFNDLVLENISLGSVTVSLESTIDLTGQSLSLSYNPATGLPSQDLDVTGQSLSTSLGTITDKQGFDVFGSLLQVTEGTVDAQIELPVPVTGQNLTASLGTAVGGLGILVTLTGQNLTVSLDSLTLPTIWSNVTTGTTSTWTPVDTGGKGVGP